jgi:hypothetical protein
MAMGEGVNATEEATQRDVKSVDSFIVIEPAISGSFVIHRSPSSR